LHYETLAFSPDGNYIYFSEQKAVESTKSDLYRSPVLGGAPQMVLRNIGSHNITFSPDGQRIAYLRWNDPEMGDCRLLTASLEGSEEKVWQTWSLASSGYPSSLAWSPNGDEIAYSLPNPTGPGGVIDVFDLGTAKSHHLATFKDKFPNEINWSPDGRSLFAMYGRSGANYMVWLPLEREQIGLLRGGGGDIEPITRDTNGYRTLTLSADGRTLATVQAKSYATISVLSQAGHGFGMPRTLLSQANEFNDFSSLFWSADGSLLVSDGSRLMKLGTEGRNPIQLLADSSAWMFDTCSCGTGYIVLEWAGHGGTNSADIWRTNADGSSPVKLTDGKSDQLPICSPDQKWVYYLDGANNRVSRVPLDGSGKAEAVFGAPEGYQTWLTDVSPDGRTLATVIEALNGTVDKAALFEIGSSSPPRMLDIRHASPTSMLRFTPDGKAVVYAIREKGVDNMWLQPLDGSAGHPITDFKSEQIWSFSLSPNGKSLAVLRGHWDSDVVLLQESKP
jgi:Tol biopolymer transport system component